MKKIIVAVGPAGVGKTSILKEAYRYYKERARNNCNFTKVKMVVTTTDRERRSGEIGDIDYHFIGKQQFKDEFKTNMFVETKESVKDDGTIDLYGLKKDALGDLNNDDILLLSIDLSGLLKLEEYLDSEGLDSNVILFPIYFKASAEARLKRCLNRERAGSSNVSDELVHKTCKRMLNDKDELKDIEDFCAITLRNEDGCEKTECIAFIIKLIQGML